jgi:hypothetical protein
MFPELPDASMDTLNPIVFSLNLYLQVRVQTNFQNNGRARSPRQRTFGGKALLAI